MTHRISCYRECDKSVSKLFLSIKEMMVAQFSRHGNNTPNWKIDILICCLEAP